MSLPTTRPGYNDYPLYGIDEISLPKNSTLIFTHPAVKKNGKSNPLYIYSGATAIQWAYNLNTQSTPTIGGEVIQVLSCSAGPMTLSGKTAGLATNKNAQIDSKFTRGWQTKGQQEPYTPNHELYAIVAWFRDYMEHAGANTFGNVRRDERAIRFQYPERGWDFWIMVTGLQGFRYDKTVLSPEWSITAEIVTDNALDYFKGLTMHSFQDDLISNVTLMGQIGLSPFSISTTETSNGAFGNTGGTKSQDPFLNPQIGNSLVDPKQIGDNFQTLVAAWTGGNTDFLNGVFSALADNSKNPQAADTVYQNLFGGDFLGNAPNPNSTTGSGSGTGSGSVTVGAGGGSNPSAGTISYSSPSDIAYAISVAFEAVGIPGYVGVAAALAESGLNPDRTQDSCTELKCGIGLFQANGNGSGRDPKANVPVPPRVYESTQGNITPYYPASMQITAAAKWFSDPTYLQGINFSTATPDEIGAYIGRAQGNDGGPQYVQYFSQAKQLIGDGATRAASLNQQTLSGTGAAVALAKTFIGTTEMPPGSNDTQFGAWYGENGVAWCAIFVSYCLSHTGTPFRQSYVPTIVSNARAGQQKTSITNAPQKGDLVCYDWENDGTFDHVGFFDSWIDQSSGTFNTVEGNTSSDNTGSQSNGGGVYARQRGTNEGYTSVFVRID